MVLLEGLFGCFRLSSYLILVKEGMIFSVRDEYVVEMIMLKFYYPNKNRSQWDRHKLIRGDITTLLSSIKLTRHGKVRDIGERYTVTSIFLLVFCLLRVHRHKYRKSLYTNEVSRLTMDFLQSNVNSDSPFRVLISSNV